MSEALEVFCRREEGLVRFGTIKSGSVLPGFSEGKEYYFRINPDGLRLYVDDAPLLTDSGRQHWVWTPGYYAGEVNAELERQGENEPIRFVLDVSPAASKTGRFQYFEYIRQIADYFPRLLLGHEPAKHGLGGRSRVESPWIGYARLRCFIDRYLSGLRFIVDRPCVRLSHRREQIPIHLARRVDATSARMLNANPALLAAVAHLREDRPAFPLEDNRINVPFNEPTLDNPANQLILLQLKEVLRLVDRLLLGFSSRQFVVSETETDVLSRMPRRIAYLVGIRKKLLKIARNPPLSFVSSTGSAGVAGLNSVSGIPHYDMTYRIGTRILRIGVSGLTDTEQQYLPPTWLIYESWCFVELAKQLERRNPDFNWCLHDNMTFADFVLEGQRGQERIRLYAQMTCPSLRKPNQYGYYSISRERKPDFVLEYINGDHHRYVCLDSKYRVSRAAILEAMESAHIYRDSIKWYEKSPVLSLLLTPSDHDASPLETPEYIEAYEVGCVRFRDGQDANALFDHVWPRLT